MTDHPGLTVYVESDSYPSSSADVPMTPPPAVPPRPAGVTCPFCSGQTVLVASGQYQRSGSSYVVRHFLCEACPNAPIGGSFYADPEPHDGPGQLELEGGPS